LIHFARAAPDVELNAIAESPVVQREGKNSFQSRINEGGRAPTQKEWLEERIRRTGNELYDDKRSAPGAGRVEVSGSISTLVGIKFLVALFILSAR